MKSTPQLTESPVEGRSLAAPWPEDVPYMQIEMFTQREMEGVPQAPWDGESPRRLTKAFQSFSLGAPPPWGLRAK